MDEKNVPMHLGIIMDGNRRFAKRLMLEPWKGHEWGGKKLEEFLGWCQELGIKELTAYTFSIQNFNRPKEEFDYLMNIFRKEFDKISKDERINKNKVRINVIGRLEMFPEDIQEMLKDIMQKTKENDGYTLNFAMAYGGREEIIDAAKKLVKAVKAGKISEEDIDEKMFMENLYLNKEPELIIRTGGEKRTSNFLAFQGTYSEYIFLDKMWPELEKEDLVACIEEYLRRKRRFGR